jgi:hypothetical protein
VVQQFIGNRKKHILPHRKIQLPCLVHAYLGAGEAADEDSEVAELSNAGLFAFAKAGGIGVFYTDKVLDLPLGRVGMRVSPTSRSGSGFGGSGVGGSGETVTLSAGFGGSGVIGGGTSFGIRESRWHSDERL